MRTDFLLALGAAIGVSFALVTVFALAGLDSTGFQIASFMAGVLALSGVLVHRHQ